MSGRLLGGAIATITGVAIGVSTFGPELKAARQKRLQEEYEREVAALKNDDSPPAPESPVAKPAQSAPLPSNASDEDEKSSKLSSVLGLWAWKSKPSDPVPSNGSPASNDRKSSSQ